MIKIILIIILIRPVGYIVMFLIDMILTSNFIRNKLVPIDNKKTKNIWTNTIITYRVNSFNILKYEDDFCTDVYYKILAKKDLNVEELNYLNKKI